MKKKKFSVRTEKKTKQDLFRVCFGSFRETKHFFFGLFRCFEPVSKQPKQTELFRNEPKQSEIFWKIPKYVLYQNLAKQKKCLLKEDEDKKISQSTLYPTNLQS